MKNLSIRLKITLWFSAALIFVVSVTYIVVLSVSNQVIQKTIRDNLTETVENNVDEIEFYTDISDFDLKNDVDHFVRHENGYLEIDDDFLDEVNEVYTALYQADGILLYGENPIAKESAELSFSDSVIQKKEINDTLYYIFDRRLTENGLDGLWLRGVVSERQGAVQINDISKISLIILPTLVLLAVVGGYLIARKTLQPIKKMSEAASQISKGGDLKNRIDLGDGKDELHQLADSFNEMIGRLDKSFEAERQFTSDASHELRTPMSVIMAQCEYSLDEPRDAEEYREALEVIRRQGRKMSRLINDMLDFIRLEIRTNSYIKEEINLSELVSSVCEDMTLIKENGITLTYESKEGITVMGSCDLLSRLLTNLISNAYRYGKENGHTHVTLSHGENEITLSVADDGIGISEEDREKIFRRFYQADSSRSGAGTGLGLSMVSEIALFHSGTVEVESELGAGSTFILHLPK